LSLASVICAQFVCASLRSQVLGGHERAVSLSPPQLSIVPLWKPDRRALLVSRPDVFKPSFHRSVRSEGFGHIVIASDSLKLGMLQGLRLGSPEQESIHVRLASTKDTQLKFFSSFLCHCFLQPPNSAGRVLHNVIGVGGASGRSSCPLPCRSVGCF
jgi:hypothetical protein